MFTPNITLAVQSLQKVAALKYGKAFCCHDAGEGVTAAELKAWAQKQ